ncbi:MAG TPA: cysteine dioxygenase family protein [Allosphingosinicella sp.]|jgi:predicted metal-dependent enzyme (double-stranded beta helix superfamily)
MTYVDPAARPLSYQTVSLKRRDGLLGAVGGGHNVELPVTGQGTVGFLLTRSEEFTVTARGGIGAPALRWTVSERDVRLDLLAPGGEATELMRVSDVGLDPSLLCPYWFSFDCHNRLMRYGKGEMRLGTMHASCPLPPPPLKKSDNDPWAWLQEIKRVEIAASIPDFVDLWKDPVTVELPMRVVAHDAITMDDIATGELTVPASLTPTCQKLYDNVAGKSFILDTPDFPEFSEAIKASILDPDGWCAQTLKRKADEFGTHDPTMTYLRITLGTNQGESPGIPFVMEIWPSGNYSPIHNHGGADAVIRVLHGEITVSLYPYLATDETKPFGEETFKTEEVTWISARLNQVHKLLNKNMDEPCITIQCYLYGDDNDTHWPYFDYLGKDSIEHFDPNSDADFLAFKATMKEEWAKRPA